MRKLYIFLLLLTFGVAEAQPTYYNHAATTGGTTNVFPFNANPGPGKRVQYVIAAGEFSLPTPAPAGNNITSLWFFSTGAGTATYTNLTIRMAMVSTSTFISTGAWYTGPMTTVLAQTTAVTPSGANTWANIPLTTPFAYDPTMNIIIEVFHCGYTGTGFSMRQLSYGAAPNFRRQYSDAASACGITPLATGGDLNLPGIGISVTPAGCTANTTANGTATINTGGGIVTISSCNFAGDYSTINGAVNGQALNFTSSVATDFITIRSGTPSGPIVTSGTTPLAFANTFTGTLYAHWNTPGCGTQNTCRTTTVQCTSCGLPPCSITLTSPPGSNNQTVCAGSAIANITYSTVTATGATFTGLPAGVTGNWTNNVVTISGNPTTNGVYNYTVTLTGCGTPTTATGTITRVASALGPMTIVAVPGTTLCAGDPALLTAHESGGTSPRTITHSSSNTISAGIGVSCGTAGVSTAINSYWRVYDLTAFPTITSNFTINSVDFGIEQLSGGTQLFTVRLYTQTGAAFPGGTRTQIASQTFNIPVQNLSIYTATFTTPPTVPNTATVVVEVEKSAVVAGQFFWPGGNASAETGPSYISAAACAITTPVTYASIGFPNTHLVMALSGTVLGVGAPVSGGTFLWSPAAGLSSTTTNPVAAAPATTTTYTVTHNGGGGCTRSANITINVNQRPTVTAHPVNRTNCVGTTATFTVTGTGTGLTYQWQQSTDGGLNYTNLTNTGPYSGVNTPTLTINPVTLAMNNYRFRAVLSGTCPPAGTANISTGAILSVSALPTVTISPSAQICGGVIGGPCNPITASGANSYVWSPVTGLFTDCAHTIPYTGTNVATVYPAPAVNTVYTVTGTNTTTGCSNTASISVVFTPPPPIVVPASASVCAGGTAQQLTIQAATPINQTFNSGPLTLAIPDNTANGVSTNITVSGIPGAAVISAMSVTLNLPHTYPADMVINLRAPNGQILNLYKHNTNTDNGPASIPSAGFFNAAISSTSAVVFSTVPNPYQYGITAPAGPYKPDALNGAIVNPGYTIMDPVGFASNAANFPALYSTPNGAWTLAICDGGPADLGTLTSWSIGFTYFAGAPPPVNGIWTPVAGLFTNAAATIPYVAGTPAQTVYALPAASTTYSVTVSSAGPPATQTFTNPALISIPVGGIANPYPSNVTVSGLPATGVSVQSVILNGVNHTWGNDVDVVLQSPTGQNVILMSDIGGTVAIPNATYSFVDGATPLNLNAANATGTYSPTNGVPDPDDFPAPGPGSLTQANPTLASFTGNHNGVWKLFVIDDDGAGDQGTINGGYTIIFNYPTPGCTSAPRLVPITVNTPISILTQPVSTAVCTDKVTSFSIVVSGTSPTYQWQVSTDNGNTFTNITNGGVYSGATSATLVITAPPVSMTNYQYRVNINGAAPCGSTTSQRVVLTVNPLPVIVIAASPYTSLLPGLVTNLTSIVTPAAALNYTWLRNGTAVPGGTNASLSVGVDGLGDYSLRVTNVNGCVSTSNTITIRDSVSGKVFIYPNPNTGQFQVRYYSAANNTGLPRGIVIYDGKGQRVFIQNYTIGRPYDRMDVDLRKLGTGVYWLEVVDANGNRMAMGRVVIAR